MRALQYIITPLAPIHVESHYLLSTFQHECHIRGRMQQRQIRQLFKNKNLQNKNSRTFDSKLLSSDF